MTGRHLLKNNSLELVYIEVISFSHVETLSQKTFNELTIENFTSDQRLSTLLYRHVQPSPPSANSRLITPQTISVGPKDFQVAYLEPITRDISLWNPGPISFFVFALCLFVSPLWIIVCSEERIPL